MTDTFTWQGQIGAQGTTRLRVRSAQFGDGYSQAVPDGINSIVRSWPLSFSGRSAYVTPIREFLIAKRGAESFFWTPPLGVQGLYRCGEYALTAHGGNLYTLTATFREVFAP